nr:hypothetical protein Q903MT_gene2738 [Picea sitchensis]
MLGSFHTPLNTVHTISHALKNARLFSSDLFQSTMHSVLRKSTTMKVSVNLLLRLGIRTTLGFSMSFDLFNAGSERTKQYPSDQGCQRSSRKLAL